MAEQPIYRPGQRASQRPNSPDMERRYISEQTAQVERIWPKSRRQYVNYNPDEYGEHEGRRERRHAALSIMNDQEALLEQALDNNETLAQTRYRLMHSFLCVRYTERFAIRYTGSEQPLEFSLNTDKKNLRYTFVSHPMSIKSPPATTTIETDGTPNTQPISQSEAGQSQAQSQPQALSQTQPRRRIYQRYPEINMVDDRLTDWWGYNDGVFSTPAAVRGDGARRESAGGTAAGSSLNSSRRRSGGGPFNSGGNRTPTRRTSTRMRR